VGPSLFMRLSGVSVRCSRKGGSPFEQVMLTILWLLWYCSYLTFVVVFASWDAEEVGIYISTHDKCSLTNCDFVVVRTRRQHRMGRGFPILDLRPCSCIPQRRCVSSRLKVAYRWLTISRASHQTNGSGCPTPYYQRKDTLGCEG